MRVQKQKLLAQKLCSTFLEGSGLLLLIPNDFFCSRYRLEYLLLMRGQYLKVLVLKWKYSIPNHISIGRKLKGWYIQRFNVWKMKGQRKRPHSIKYSKIVLAQVSTCHYSIYNPNICLYTIIRTWNLIRSTCWKTANKQILEGRKNTAENTQEVVTWPFSAFSSWKFHKSTYSNVHAFPTIGRLRLYYSKNTYLPVNDCLHLFWSYT